MKKIIKSCDYLVQPFEFNIKEQEGANSMLGGFLTIIIMIFTLFYFLGALIKNFSSLNDIYAGSQSEQNNNQMKQLENTLVAIEFSTDKGEIISNITEISQYFNITGQFVQQQRIEEVQGYTRNYSNLNKIRCEKNKVEQFNFDPQAMTNYQQENLLCFDGYFHLQGQFYDSYFSYFRIMVQVCDNSTSNSCKSLEEINNLINSGIKIDLFVQGARIRSIFNESSPAAKYSSNIYWKLNNQMADNEDIYIETIALDLKKSYLLNELFGIESSERIYNGQGIQKQERRQESTIITNGAVLASFYLRESTDFQYYFVNQQDYTAIVFQAVSQATGLCLALLEFIRFFYSYYSSHYTFEMIMNNVYQFNLRSIKKRYQEKKKQKNSDTQLDQILHYKISFSFFSYVWYEIKKYFKKMRSTCDQQLGQQQKQEKQTDRESEIIISSIAKKKIESDLDLTNILKKLYEIDCLKLLLLDDNQLMLFNSICKPLFTDQTEEQIQENKKMVKEVEQQSLSQLQLLPPRVNQSQAQRDSIIQQAASSTIPIQFRLANLAWFFKSQLKLPSKLLVHNYQEIKRNCLSNMNKKLLTFTEQNKELNQLLDKMTKQAVADDQTETYQQTSQQQIQRNQNNNNSDHQIVINQNINNSGQVNEQLEISQNSPSVEN